MPRAAVFSRRAGRVIRASPMDEPGISGARLAPIHAVVVLPLIAEANPVKVGHFHTAPRPAHRDPAKTRPRPDVPLPAHEETRSPVLAFEGSVSCLNVVIGVVVHSPGRLALAETARSISI